MGPLPIQPRLSDREDLVHFHTLWHPELFEKKVARYYYKVLSYRQAFTTKDKAFN